MLLARINILQSRTSFRTQHRAIDECLVDVLGRNVPQVDALALAIETMALDEPALEPRGLVKLNQDQHASCMTMLEYTDEVPVPRYVLRDVCIFVHVCDVGMLRTLQGPPGTGKSTVLARAVIRLLREKPDSKILLCAPSNEAVDVITKYVVGYDEDLTGKLLRLNPLKRSFEDVPEELRQFSNTREGENTLHIPKIEDICSYRIVACTCSTASYLWSSVEPGERDLVICCISYVLREVISPPLRSARMVHTSVHRRSSTGH